MYRIFYIAVVLMFTSLLAACGSNGSASSTNPTASQVVSTKDSINLSWTAPSTRADGSYLSLTDLAGYKVYMGTTSDNLSALVDLSDDTITNYTVNNLPAGSYYFAVSAYDVDGAESGYSQIILIQLS
ncbi:MAG: fibronectin type III domain-containing protein [Candidatus Thiodiazotropha sp. (ex Notomyrtea botanica)]|nr:fibronectin type III domain-containing protein [Candidatus Thiodiazotropha sp. (ex Notomyrtea botanica)]